MVGALRRAAWACLLFSLVSWFPMRAQSPTAGAVGIIRDSSGAVVPDATVKVRNMDTNILRKGVSGQDGGFSVPNLTPGRYEVTVEKKGFQVLRQTDLELQVNQTARLELQLKVGPVSEVVEVKAQVPLLNTENSARGDVIVTDELLQMPLDGRSFQDLAFLVPNVLPEVETDNGGTMAINGARSDNTSFYIDGFSSRNLNTGAALTSPNLDAMQEFKLETSGYSAEYGRVAGGVISVALKSGTNLVHGALFEFLRNDKFDARNFFATDKNKLRRNQFGGLLSGPVVVPKLFNGHDHTFFLFSWESYRDATGNIRLSRVPTALERQGDFSQTVGTNGRVTPIKDPFAANALFPGNVIPISRFNSISAEIIPYWPLPNQPNQVNNYYASASSRSPWDSFLWKFDETISSHDSASFRYQRRTSGGTGPWIGNGSPLGTFGYMSDGIQHLMGLNLTHLFTPALINEFRFSLSRVKSHSANLDAGHNYAAQLGIIGGTTDPYLVGFPLINVSGLAALGDYQAFPSDNVVNLYQWSDTLTWVKGRHQIKFGGEIDRAQTFQPYYSNTRGIYNFLGTWTGQPLSDFLLGLLNSATRQGVPPRTYLFQTDLGVFVQDDFKVTPRLTLNFGLRWEAPGHQSDKFGRIAGFVQNVGKIIVADDRTVPNLAQLASSAGLSAVMGVARDYGIPQSLVYTRYRSFAPRFGFAWRPFGGNGTVLRGGYGIFNSMSANLQQTAQMSNVFPFAINQAVGMNANNPSALSFADAFRNASGSSVSVGGMDLHAPTQYLQSWNLTVERALRRVGALEIAYAGSKGTHLQYSADINQINYSLQRLPNGLYPRAYPQLSNSIPYLEFGANSIYNSGAITLRRRFVKGFFYRANYVYAKSIDDASTGFYSFSNGTGPASHQIQDPRDLAAERGRSNFDVGHTFTMDFSYEIPWRLGELAWLMGGWQLAGSGRAATGAPLTMISANFNPNLGGAVRPDRLSSGKLAHPTPERWFDVSAFPTVPNGSFRYGNSGRGILDAPGFQAINLSLHKNIRLREHGQIQFRWEAFNALNHTNFNQPSTAVNVLTGGTIAAANASRSMQLGLRYEF